MSRGNGHPEEKVDRLPPHSEQAEQGVLGCILLGPEATMPICVDYLKPEAMYDLRHRTIYETLVAMYDERIPIDFLTLATRLQDLKKLDAVGGMAYLNQLPDAVPSAANLEYYAQMVSEKYRLRKIIQIASDVVGRAYESESGQDAEDTIDWAEREMMRLSEGVGQKTIPRMAELVARAIDTIEHLHQNHGIITGLTTGFIDLDKLTSGLHGGEMIVIAARPAMGKTSMAMNIAETIAVDERLPVGVFSLEMTADSLMMRMLCSRARVNLRTIRDGFLAERDFPRLTGAAAKLQNAPLHIDDSSGLSILQLRSKARRMMNQFGIKLFVVDYIQLLHSNNRKVDNRQQEVADISGGIKNLAKELNVPIIVLSQLNREVERDGKRRPRLSDLRESGAIEQDADFVGLLYKTTDSDDEKGYEGDCIPINLYIAKQRNGASGIDIALTFLRSYTRFESAAKISADDAQQGLAYKDD